MRRLKKHIERHIHTIERWIFIAVLACLVAGVAYAGHYLYTGKGWLLLKGQESLADFYFNRGLYYFNGGAYNLTAAQKSFERTLALSDGKYRDAYFQLSRTYFIVGDLSASLQEANAELQAFPDNSKVHYLKGLIYGYRKQYIQAVPEFKAFLEAVPDSWAAHNDLAWIYFSEGDYVSAAAIAKEGLDQKPGIPWLQNSYAVAEMNLGNYKIAEQYFQEAQRTFATLTPEQWGMSYPGNNPGQYGNGLEQTRAAIAANLELVHSKLQDQ